MLYGCHCRKSLVEDGQPGRLCGLNKRDDEDRHGSAVPAGGCLAGGRIRKLSSGEKADRLDSAVNLIINISEDVTKSEVENLLVPL